MRRLKRALAMLFAVIFSVAAGIEFTLPKEDEFMLRTEDSTYYWSPADENGELNAADLYRLMYGTVDNTKPKCKTENYTPPRGGVWPASPPYPFAIIQGDGVDYVACPDHPDATIKQADLTVSPLFESQYYVWQSSEEVTGDIYICAPVTGTIETSHYSCDYGSHMSFEFEYDGGVWLMVIDGAKCWYCCRDKADSDAAMAADGRTYYTANTSDSLKGHQVGAGQLLVVGDKNTVVKFTKTSG